MTDQPTHASDPELAPGPPPPSGTSRHEPVPPWERVARGEPLPGRPPQSPPPGFRPGYGPSPFQQPGPGSYVPPPQKKSQLRGCLIAVVIGAAVMLGAYVLAPSRDASTPGYKTTNLRPVYLEDQSGRWTIAVADIDGLLIDGMPTDLLGLPLGDNPVAYLEDVLDQVTDDATVTALVLKLDTPGGTITASDIMRHRLDAFKAEMNKRGRTVPVVVLMGDLCASGGYYVASGADYIVAHPTTMTGSIGVVMAGMNYNGLMERFGVEDTTVTSVPDKDMMSPTAPMEPYDRHFFQAQLMAMHRQFEDVVFSGRSAALSSATYRESTYALTRAEVEQWADGTVWLADEAKQALMIDAIGYHHDAIDYAAKMSVNPGPYNIVQYERPKPDFNLASLFLQGQGVDPTEGMPPTTPQTGLLPGDSLWERIQRGYPRVWALWLGP